MSGRELEYWFIDCPNDQCKKLVMAIIERDTEVRTMCGYCGCQFSMIHKSGGNDEKEAKD